MKKGISLILAVVLCSGCLRSKESPIEQAEAPESPAATAVSQDPVSDDMQYNVDYYWDVNTAFQGLDDNDLLAYVEDSVYKEAVKNLPSGYYVRNVSTSYVSKEYLEELEYNSRKNIYFGYTLQEIEKQFQDTAYVFTVGENGETTVVPVEYYTDDTFNKVTKNVAIGTGVILVCVTVSAVSAGVGAPAVSMIFAASAKTGAAMAVSSGTIGGLTSGLINYVQTGDMDDALNAAALGASEGFKCGAIAGALSGGVSEAYALFGHTNELLNASQLELIQKESGYPLDVIDEFHTFDEYKVFRDANLQAELIDGKTALVRTDIDLTTIVDEFGRNNLQRMLAGNAPLDANGLTYELHHIGQEANGTLALLTQAEHDNIALHGFKAISEINRNLFQTQRQRFYKDFAKLLIEGGL